MKAVFALAASLLLCTALNNLHAQPAGMQQRRLVLETLDLDHDGALSAAEVAQAPQNLLLLDRDHDGILVANELMARPADQAQGDQQLAQKLMAFDKQGKGYLTEADLPERMKAIFARNDANHDGKLTLEELTAAGARQAGPAGGGNARGNSLEFFKRDPILATLDLNHDGELSASEIAAAAASLQLLDLDHDGTLTAREIAVHQMTVEERVHHMLDEFDGDKDGRIARAEAPERMQAEFDKIDKDGDGYLSADELQHFFAAMAERQTNAQGAPR